MFRRTFVLHCVKAWGPMMTILRTYDFHGMRFIVHSFIGPKEILKELIEMGACISISQRSLGQKDADSIIARIPDERILLETDFPYLPGKEKDEAGIQDYMAAIKQVYAETARLRDVPVENLVDQVRDNAKEILKYM